MSSYRAAVALLPWTAALALAAPFPVDPRSEKTTWVASFGEPDQALVGPRTGTWTPDGKYVLTGGWKRPKKGAPSHGEVRVWNASAGTVVRVHHGSAFPADFQTGRLAVTADGKMVASGGCRQRPGEPGRYEFYAEVWDWGRARPRLKLEGFQLRIQEVAFSADGKLLAAVDIASNLRAWEADTGKQVFSAYTPGRRKWGVAFHPKLPLVATAEDGGTVRLFDAATGKGRGGCDHSRVEQYLSVAFSPDGKTLAAGGDAEGGGKPVVALLSVREGAGGAVVLGDVRKCQFDRTDQGRVEQVAFSPDGKLLAAACFDKTVRLFDPTSGRLLALARGHLGTLWSVAFSPDGRRLLSVCESSVRVWSVAEVLKLRPGK